MAELDHDTEPGGRAGAQTAAPWVDLLSRPAVEAAPLVLGAVLTVRTPDGGAGVVPGDVAIRLTEVEAYSGESDPGSHAYRGLTARTAPMFEDGGRLYVYFTYGMHWCANLVCGTAGTASALLLRGGEVVSGLEVARSRRPAARADRDLARGPARLAQALGLSGADSGLELAVGGRAELTPGERVDAGLVRTGPRVGVAGAGGDGAVFPWRFWIDGEPSVSVYRPAAPRRR
jgi:DNA-3-methyladenine glycosylase